METKQSKFRRFIINVNRYNDMFYNINKAKELNAKTLLQKLEHLEKFKHSHVVYGNTKKFTLLPKHCIIVRGTLLHVASACGYSRIMAVLLEGGADIEAKCSNGFTPLHYAVNCGIGGLADILLDAKANVNAVDRKGCTPLHFSAANGAVNTAKTLLLAGADVSARDKYGNTPLHFAVNGRVKECILKMVSVLVHFGADVDAKDQEDNTVLHRTILKRNSKILLEGLSSDYKGDYFKEIAKLTKDDITDKVVEFLLAHGAIAEARNSSGDTILHCAIIFSSLRVIKLLIRYGADVNARDSSSQGPLYCLHGRLLYKRAETSEIVNIFLENGSDIDATNKNGVSTLEAIIRSNSLSLARIVIIWALVKDPERKKPIYLDSLSRYWDVVSSNVRGELRRMRIGHGHEAFDFVFSKNINKLASYMGNPNVHLLIESGQFKSRFPMYAHKILSQYHKGMKRLGLLNDAVESITKLYHASTKSSKILPVVLARKIAFYLSNTEIKHLKSVAEYLAIKHTKQAELNSKCENCVKIFLEF